jgi:beta-lactamase superfamily II metal-dependent hydrolase
LAIVSVGRNGYGHPSPAAVHRILDAGAEIRQTDTCGAVSVSITSRGAAQAMRRWAGYVARDMRGVWARAPMFRRLQI